VYRIFRNTISVSIIIAAAVFLNGCMLFKVVAHLGPAEKVAKGENLKAPWIRLSISLEGPHELYA
jgi:hypothetical protein